MTEEVILVNSDDEVIGTMEKLEAHRRGVLHRAFSVFIINDRNEMLLQQRAPEKYHSGGLWTNACCSHPRPGEPLAEAAIRRLQEEMGIRCALHNIFHFTYKATFDNGLSEYELDHVFVGHYSEAPHPDPTEAISWKFRPLDAIRLDLAQHPEHYTHWFRIAFERVCAYLLQQQ